MHHELDAKNACDDTKQNEFARQQFGTVLTQFDLVEY
jgi:hypothetical protein